MQITNKRQETYFFSGFLRMGMNDELSMKFPKMMKMMQ